VRAPRCSAAHDVRQGSRGLEQAIRLNEVTPAWYATTRARGEAKATLEQAEGAAERGKVGERAGAPTERVCEDPSPGKPSEIPTAPPRV
jgi:hypothetical protein